MQATKATGWSVVRRKMAIFCGFLWGSYLFYENVSLGFWFCSGIVIENFVCAW